MLVDFADVLEGVSVRTLGRTFLELCSSLAITPPLLDPSLYIHRFAARLSLGEAEPAVAETALRLVQRMNRDWLQTGRRPAGLCGAALIIASRMRGFLRTPEQVARIVRIGDGTLRKRIQEFTATPAAGLTPSQFESMLELQATTVPPSYVGPPTPPTP